MMDGLKKQLSLFGSVYSNSCLSKDKNRQVPKAWEPRAGKEAPYECKLLFEEV